MMGSLKSCTKTQSVKNKAWVTRCENYTKKKLCNSKETGKVNSKLFNILKSGERPKGERGKNNNSH